MPKKKDSGLNRLLCSEIMKFNDDPLLGVIVMQTVDGDIVLAVNKNTAEQLQAELTQLLLASSPH
ncbi:hypothetical protein [Phyllobacterium sp. YR531]|uniref:hypothetical protein n=1 Tax=Phyllobacterium sp. YR531 TaxID=1144343 RepID=UPI00026F6CF9|nr:hypothetical protein [Phyllobacterium sp. YR531]EJN01622.1 hypothetical protein PMI41_03335 [Phyllobacterium sp. YR531]